MSEPPSRWNWSADEIKKVGYRVVDLYTLRAFSFDQPADIVTRMPGLWLAGIGLVILARATYEMLQEPRLR